MVLNNICHLNPEVMLRLSYLCSPDVLPVRWLLQVLLLKKYLPELPLSLQEVWPFQMLRCFCFVDFVVDLGIQCLWNESCSDSLNLMRTCFFLLKVPVKKPAPMLRSELPVSALLSKHRFRKVFRLFRHLRSRYRLLRLYRSRSQDLLSSCVLAGLAGFTNCPGTKLFGISFASSSAFAMAPFIPLAPSVSTISAP